MVGGEDIFFSRLFLAKQPLNKELSGPSCEAPVPGNDTGRSIRSQDQGSRPQGRLCLCRAAAAVPPFEAFTVRLACSYAKPSYNIGPLWSVALWCTCTTSLTTTAAGFAL